MEFEIINEILTSTVANLFPNRSIHMSYFKSEEDSNKADIPKSSNRKEGHDSFAIEQWKQNEGRKKLEDALARLKIDELKIKNKENIAFMTTEQLSTEKYRVKNELKQYDNEFLSLFRRMPNRSEKEIMRPLYMYYKNLKNAIENKKNDSNQKYSSNNSSSAVNTSNSSNANVNNNSKRINTNSSFNSKDNNVSEVNTGSNNIYSFNNVYNKEGEKKTIEKNEKKVQSNTISYSGSSSSSSSQPKAVNSYSLKEPNNMKEIGDDLFGGAVQKSNFNSNINLSTMNDKQLKKLTEDLETEYTSLKRDQSDLKTRLHDYHHEFFQIHNRKVKYYKDIVPVENDYKKYKENKSRILEIQDLLMRIKKHKSGHK